MTAVSASHGAAIRAGPLSARERAGGLLAAIGAGALAARAPLLAGAAATAVVGLLTAPALPALWAANILSAASFLSGLAIDAGGLKIRPEQVLAPLVAVALLLRRRAGRVPGETALAALWVFTGVAGAFGEPEAERAYLHAARLAATCLPVVLLPAFLSRRRDAERAWDAFLLLATLEAAVGAAAYASHAALGTSFGVTQEKNLRLLYVSAHGTLLEPNILGALSAAAAVASALRAMDRSLAPARRLAAGLAVLVTGTATLLSVTRAAWLALPLGLAVALGAASWLARGRRGGMVLRRRWARAALSVLFLALAAGLFAAGRLGEPGETFTGQSGIAAKLASITRGTDDPNVAVRLRTYGAALSLFRRSPLLGMGHGAMERLPGSEDRTLAWAGNLEVHLLADTGLVGLALMLTFVSLVTARVYRAARRAEGEERRRHLERLGALGVLMLCSQATETSWLASFWVLFGLALAAAPDREAGTSALGAGGDARRLRILYVHPSDELYGSDRVLLELLCRLDRQRFEPRVLLSSDVPYADRLSRRVLALDIPVTRLRIGVLRRQALGSPLRAARFAVDVAASTLRITRLLHAERIDLVHANTVTVLPAAFAARLAGRRLVWHVHELVTERPGRGVLHFVVRTLAHRVVVVSEAAKEALAGGVRGGPEVIPNGIERRERSGPPADPPLIAYVGRLSRRKGPDVLLRAAGRLAERHPRARFVFAGDEFGGGDALSRELLREAARLGLAGRVELHPFREDVTGLLAEATVVVSPSILPESFGLILLEAMASGRAVVASDHGGPRELVVDGVSGFLVPPGDDEALAGALDRLLSEPGLAERMGEAGRLRALTRFSLEASVSRFASLYEEVTAARPSSRRGPRDHLPAS